MAKEPFLQRFWNNYIWNSRSLENPQIPISDANVAKYIFGLEDGEAGVNVNLGNTMGITAFYRAVMIRSNTIASVPFNVHTKDKDGSREVDEKHPAHRLIKYEPNENQNAYEFWKLLQSWADTHGNGYAEIERDGNGQPMALWPLHPTKVDVYWSDKSRTVAYKIGQEDKTYKADDILHIKNFSYDGVVGVAPIGMAKDALGISIASQLFVERFFGNNATPSGILSVEQELDKEKSDTLKARWSESYGGKNNHKPAVLGLGANYIPITMPMDQAQMIQLRKFSVTEIGRLMGVPPNLLFDLERETHNNIEHNSIGWVRDTVRPIAIGIEQECNRKLLTTNQRRSRSHYTEHNLQGLLRGDSESTANYLQSLSNIGAISQNEVRQLLNMNKIEDPSADLYWMQQGFAPTELITKKMEKEIFGNDE